MLSFPCHVVTSPFSMIKYFRNEMICSLSLLFVPLYLIDQILLTSTNLIPEWLYIVGCQQLQGWFVNVPVFQVGREGQLVGGTEAAAGLREGHRAGRVWENLRGNTPRRQPAGEFTLKMIMILMSLSRGSSSGHAVGLLFNSWERGELITCLNFCFALVPMNGVTRHPAHPSLLSVLAASTNSSLS